MEKKEGQIRIVIADDQSLFRKGISLIIKGFKGVELVGEAGNGQELLDLLRKSEIPPHIILLDLNMPELNGIEVTPVLRREFPELKIIILSVYNDERFILRMIEEGAHGYLVKNADIPEVERAIREVAEHGIYMNEDSLRAIRSRASFKKNTAGFGNEELLTKRELEVLEQICQEKTAAEIADTLCLSIRTVEGHRQNLLEKTRCRNTAGLVLYAVRNDLLDLGFAKIDRS